MAAAVDPQLLTRSRGGGEESDKAGLALERGLGRWVGDRRAELSGGIREGGHSSHNEEKAGIEKQPASGLGLLLLHGQEIQTNSQRSG